MKYFLSICTAIAILGCGTNGDYKSKDGGTVSDKKDETTDKKEEVAKDVYQDKGGLTGVVYIDETLRTKTNLKVCFDVNTNGICDNNEASEDVYKGGKYSFAKSVSEANKNAILLTAPKTEEAVSVLTSYTNNITPYTTLVVNEVLYNPNANADIKQAKTLLSKKFNAQLLDGKIVANDDIKKLNATFQKAIEKGGNVYDSIANAVDGIYKQDTLSPNVVINEQKRADTLSGVKLTISKIDKSLTWDKNDEDESFMGVSANSKNIISYSRWHNSLHVIDPKTQSLVSSEKFLDISGKRHAIDSQTGASEQLLKKVTSDDEGNIFALVVKNGEKTADGLGIYKTSIKNGVPNLQYSHVEKGTDFYALNEGQDLAVFGNILVAGSKEGINIFSTTNLTKSQKYSAIGNVKSVGASEGFVFAGLNKRKENKLIAFNDALSEIGSININELTASTASNIYPNHIVAYKNNFYFSVNDDDLGNKIYCYEIDGTKLNAKKQISASGEISNLSLSKDGKMLLVTTWNKKLQVYQTDNFASTSSDLSKIGRGAFKNNSYISVSYKDSFDFYDLKQEITSLTQEQKDTWTNEHRK